MAAPAAGAAFLARGLRTALATGAIASTGGGLSTDLGLAVITGGDNFALPAGDIPAFSRISSTTLSAPAIFGATTPLGSTLPEDETKRLEKEIQTATDKAIAEINSHLSHKEKELLTV